MFTVQNAAFITNRQRDEDFSKLLINIKNTQSLLKPNSTEKLSNEHVAEYSMVLARYVSKYISIVTYRENPYSHLLANSLDVLKNTGHVPAWDLLKSEMQANMPKSTMWFGLDSYTPVRKRFDGLTQTVNACLPSTN